jgi:hypothetical protein
MAGPPFGNAAFQHSLETRNCCRDRVDRFSLTRRTRR